MSILDCSYDAEEGLPGLPEDLPCRTHDPDMWFSTNPVQIENAKALCRTCELRQPCLKFAVRNREPWGVWGGEVFVSGRAIPFKRGPGRPRKHPRTLRTDLSRCQEGTLPNTRVSCWS